MSGRVRKLALTAHVTSSLGWFGAVATFLMLAIAGMISKTPSLAGAAYVAMQWTTWFVIVPLAFASLLSGVAAGIGTRWGLFRYYWVLVKLLLTSVSIAILWVHTQPIDLLAGLAARASVFGADLRDLQRLLVTASAAALAVLLVLTVLSIYKPQGLTGHGARKQEEQRTLLEG